MIVLCSKYFVQDCRLPSCSLASLSLLASLSHADRENGDKVYNAILPCFPEILPHLKALRMPNAEESC